MSKLLKAGDRVYTTIGKQYGTILKVVRGGMIHYTIKWDSGHVGSAGLTSSGIVALKQRDAAVKKLLKLGCPLSKWESEDPVFAIDLLEEVKQ